MKSLIIILSISLMPFAALADSLSEDSTLWAELFFKESVLSAISSIETTNEKLGLGPSYTPPPKNLSFTDIAIPLAAGSFGVAVSIIIAADRPFGFLLSEYEWQILDKYKTSTRSMAFHKKLMEEYAASTLLYEKHQKKFNQAQRDRNKSIKSKSKFRPSFKPRQAMAAMGSGVIALAGIGAFVFITSEIMYIKIYTPHLLPIKEQYSADVENLKRVLL